MSATNAPFGLAPADHPSGNIRPRMIKNGIPTGYGTAIYKYQPVTILSTGLLAPVAATTSNLVGAFAGVEYTDANGRRQISNQWVASTTATDVNAYIWDDPEIVYEIQADGSLAQTAIGDQANFTNLTANGAGMSQCTIGTSLAGSGTQGQLAIIDKSYRVDNDWGDAYTVVQVKIARHQYRYPQVAF